MKRFQKMISVLMAVIMLVSMLPMVVANAGGYTELTLRVLEEVACNANVHRYSFSPAKTEWYKFTSVSEDVDPYATLYNSDFDEIGYSDDEDGYDYCLVIKLYAGQTYYFETATYENNGNSTFIFDVDVAVAPVSLEIVKEPDNATVIKGYEFETMDYSGIEVEFTMSDGSKELWNADEWGKVGDCSVDIQEGVVGGDNYYIDIMSGEAFKRFFFTTVEPDVKSIEYSCDEEISFYENSNGTLYPDYEGFCYFYKIPENAVITVTYNDGTTKKANYWEGLDGIQFETYDEQPTDPWTVGSDNYFYISYLGVKTKVPVTIKETPIKNVNVLSAPDRIYYYGDPVYGGYNFLDVYCLDSRDLEGLVFEVVFKDGTKKTYTGADIDYDDWTIDGEYYHLYEIECDKGAGVYKAEVQYMGYKFTYDVVVDECPIESIEFIKNADRLEYESYYYPVLDGLKLKVNMTDGTSKYIDVTEDNVEYICNNDIGFAYLIKGAGLEIMVQYDMDEEYVEYYAFSCCGYTQDYYGYKFRDTREPEQVTFENVSADGDGMKVFITYKDGTKDELTLDLLVKNASLDFCEGYAMTKNGIMYYTLDIMDNYDGTAACQIYLLGRYYDIELENFFAPALKGDVDQDTEVSVMDATYIQRYVAQLTELDDIQYNVADTNDDGRVDIMDATQIQRFIAQLIPEL